MVGEDLSLVLPSPSRSSQRRSHVGYLVEYQSLYSRKGRSKNYLTSSNEIPGQYLI